MSSIFTFPLKPVEVQVIFWVLPMIQDSPPLGERREREGIGSTVISMFPSAKTAGSRAQDALTFSTTAWLIPVVFRGAVQVGFGKLGFEKEPCPMEEERTDQEYVRECPRESEAETERLVVPPEGMVEGEAEGPEVIVTEC